MDQKERASEGIGFIGQSLSIYRLAIMPNARRRSDSISDPLNPMRGIRHLFSFKGRAGRGEYFLHSVADIFILFVFAIAFAEVGSRTKASEILDTINIVLFVVVFFGGIVAEVCVTVRRLHDLGRSGSHFFLTWVPLYNIYLALLLLFEAGDKTANEFGPARLKK